MNTTPLAEAIAWAEAHIVAGARWLIKEAGIANADVAKMEASNPLVADAAAQAIKIAEANNVPVAAIEQVGAAVLDAAQAIVAGAPAVTVASTPAAAASVLRAPAYRPQPIAPGVTTAAMGGVL